MMRTLARFSTAASALALASMLGGCASIFSGGSAEVAQPGDPDFALATRAMAAFNSGNYPAAIDLAERAVEQTPDDATIRALLADAYFSSGRFTSAEAAYGDSLSLAPVQPRAALKLALVKIALGKTNEALGVLETAKTIIPAADYGLAAALAGRPDEAIRVLEYAARQPRADARIRQNLALAHGLAGDWLAARTIAAQDIPASQLDSRLQQWMALANPTRPSDQVAALVGVVPAPIDPGQPVRLALHDTGTQYAVAETAPQPVAQAAVEVPMAAPMTLAATPLPAPMPLAETPQSRPVADFAPAPVPEPQSEVVEAAYIPPVVDSLAPKPAQSEAAPAAAAKLAAARKDAPKVRPASLPRKATKAGFVVQLGAYSSADRVSVAWDSLTERYPVLREYAPVRARFDSAKGPVWRLSIEGFSSQREAIQRCEALQQRGGSCFVRPVKGDSAIQLASR